MAQVDSGKSILTPFPPPAAIANPSPISSNRVPIGTLARSSNNARQQPAMQLPATDGIGQRFGGQQLVASKMAYPISLPVALSLSGSSALDVQIAEERVRAACAQLDRARVLWLPNFNMGIDYFRHDGQIQDIVGNVFTTSRQAMMVGAGPQAVIATNRCHSCSVSCMPASSGGRVPYPSHPQ